MKAVINIVLVLLGVYIATSSCQDVTVGFLQVEDASYNTDTMVVVNKADLDPDDARIKWNQPWVSNPIEGVYGTAQIYVTIKAIKTQTIVCLGIGENGHIAFNDPDVANFNDSHLVKVVELDPICRQQQVNEKCFEAFDLVPAKALTLTIPALLKADWMFCIVPFKNKANAVYNTLYGEISEKCPASILRKKENSCLYLDPESAERINL